MVLTTEQLNHIDNTWKLTGYRKSHIFTVGYDLWLAEQEDAAVDAFKRGADNVGCVPCMVLYVALQRGRGNFHLVVPYALEAAFRGNQPCMNQLVECYNNSKPVLSLALSGLWVKMSTEFGFIQITEERRKEIKKDIANCCFICRKKESEDNDVTLVQCGICKSYSYCGKNCQTRHGQEGKHMNECRQVILLRKYCKPSYIEEIREAIIGGQDPKKFIHYKDYE